MKRRDAIRDLYTTNVEPKKLAMANSASDLESEAPERVLAGPVRTMGLALDKLEQESRALQDALAQGVLVVEIEPDLIEGSFVRDRLDGGEAEFEDFKRSIETRGQEVPILVRPHQTKQGRYQVAYGHRRLHAVAQLGRKVRAVVRSMSDVELVVAQGVENSARKDLSYIERAVFACRLEDRGFERVVIMDALSTDKGELSKLISVARAVPEHLVSDIGPAPKAGRRRWLALADLLERQGVDKAVQKVVDATGFKDLDTDLRFAKVLSAATSKFAVRSKPITWKGDDGAAAANIARSGSTVILSIDHHPDFGEFVAHQLDELYREFRSRANRPVGGEK